MAIQFIETELANAQQGNGRFNTVNINVKDVNVLTRAIWAPRTESRVSWRWKLTAVRS